MNLQIEDEEGMDTLVSDLREFRDEMIKGLSPDEALPYAVRLFVTTCEAALIGLGTTTQMLWNALQHLRDDDVAVMGPTKTEAIITVLDALIEQPDISFIDAMGLESILTDAGLRTSVH